MKATRVFTVLAALLLLGSFCIWAQGDQEDGKTRIRVAHFYDSMGDDNSKLCLRWFESVKEQFENDNPNTEVVFEQLKWDEIDVKMMSDYRAGITEHDITLSSPQLMPQHALVGTFHDLNEFIDRDWTADELADFSWASTWDKGNQNGERIAIPLGSHSRVAIYNKTMFEEAGLNPEEPPKSLEEVIEMAKKLTVDKDGDGTIDQYGLGLALGPDRATTEATFGPFLWGFGGVMWDPETKKAVFANEEGIKTAELIYDIINNEGIVSPSAVVKDYSRNIYDSFLDEKVAIAIGWGSYWTGVLEELGFIDGLFPPSKNGKMVKVGLFPYPTSVEAGFVNSWSVSMYSKSENKETAWDFINYMLKEDNLRTYPDAGLPIRKTEWEKEEYQNPFYEMFYSSIETGRPMPSTAHYGELSDTIASNLQQIMNGEKSEIPGILLEAQNQFNNKYQGE